MDYSPCLPPHTATVYVTDLKTIGIPCFVVGPIPSIFLWPKSTIFFGRSFSLSCSLRYSFFTEWTENKTTRTENSTKSMQLKWIFCNLGWDHVAKQRQNISNLLTDFIWPYYSGRMILSYLFSLCLHIIGCTTTG